MKEIQGSPTGRTTKRKEKLHNAYAAAWTAAARNGSSRSGVRAACGRRGQRGHRLDFDVGAASRRPRTAAPDSTMTSSWNGCRRPDNGDSDAPRYPLTAGHVDSAASYGQLLTIRRMRSGCRRIVNGILWEMWELINTLRKYFAVHWLPYITGHWNCCHVIHTRLNWLPKQSFPASTGTWLPIGNRAYKGLSAFVKSLVARTRRCGEYRQVKFIWFRWTRVARFIPSRISPTALASLVRPTVQYTVQRHSACHFWQGNYLDCA